MKREIWYTLRQDKTRVGKLVRLYLTEGKYYRMTVDFGNGLVIDSHWHDFVQIGCKQELSQLAC
jgi:hypothetical protein